MNNYTTLKSKFLTISDKLRNSEYFSLEIDGYIHNSGFEDETNIYIKYISTSSSTSCKTCDDTITRNKGKRNVTILLGVFNGKSVIGNFEKKIYFCSSCNKQSVDRITNVPDNTSYYSVVVNDGFYNIDNLITTINTNSTSANAKIAFAKQDYTNKIIITNSVPLATTPSVEIRTLVFPNNCTANMYGFKQRLIPLNNAPVYSDTYVNIMNFSKIILSTDLAFSIKTCNEISNDGSVYTKGIGNILEWVDADDTPFTCIKYKNVENTIHKLDNRFISQFKLLFCTEKSLPIVLDNFIIHLQIIKYKK